MEAACRGAAQAGGPSLGVVLGSGGPPNRRLTESVVAEELSERLRRLRDLADAWIFLPHGLGTMLELVWIAESVVKGDAAVRPLVLLGDFWRPTVDTALAEASNPAGKAALTASIRFAATPAEAVALALGSREL
jgi:predicted Rossmann-fold nucleotide-binding protein